MLTVYVIVSLIYSTSSNLAMEIPPVFSSHIRFSLLTLLLFCRGQIKDFRVLENIQMCITSVHMPGFHCSCQVEKQGRGAKGEGRRGSWCVRILWLIANWTGKTGSHYHLPKVKCILDYKNASWKGFGDIDYKMTLQNHLFNTCLEE